jgi:hypothetical protein
MFCMSRASSLRVSQWIGAQCDKKQSSAEIVLECPPVEPLYPNIGTPEKSGIRKISVTHGYVWCYPTDDGRFVPLTRPHGSLLHDLREPMQVE